MKNDVYEKIKKLHNDRARLRTETDESFDLMSAASNAGLSLPKAVHARVEKKRLEKNKAEAALSLFATEAMHGGKHNVYSATAALDLKAIVKKPKKSEPIKTTKVSKPKKPKSDPKVIKERKSSKKPAKPTLAVDNSTADQKTLSASTSLQVSDQI